MKKIPKIETPNPPRMPVFVEKTGKVNLKKSAFFGVLVRFGISISDGQYIF